MSAIETPCPVCGSDGYRVLYPSTIRGRTAAPSEYGLPIDGHHPIVSCLSCGTAYTRPRDSDESLAALAVGGLNGYLAQEAAKRAMFRRQLAEIEALCGGKGNLLEVGCATGLFCLVARENGWRSSGCDVWAEAVEYGREGFGLNLYCGSIEAMPAAGSFDATVLWDALEHLSQPGQVLAQAGERLKPGGVLALSTPNFGSFSRRLMGSRWHFFERHHLVFFNRRSLEKLLAGAGYRAMSFRSQWKVVSLDYLFCYLAKLWPAGSRALRRLAASAGAGRLLVRVPSGMLICYARKNE